jgi:hypothetical protein
MATSLHLDKKSGHMTTLFRQALEWNSQLKQQSKRNPETYGIEGFIKLE